MSLYPNNDILTCFAIAQVDHYTLQATPGPPPDFVSQVLSDEWTSPFCLHLHKDTKTEEWPRRPYLGPAKPKMVTICLFPDNLQILANAFGVLAGALILRLARTL